MNVNLPQVPLKMKALLISADGGRTWLISRQFFLAELRTQRFLEPVLEGTYLSVVEEEGSEHVDASGKSLT